MRGLSNICRVAVSEAISSSSIRAGGPPARKRFHHYFEQSS